MSSRDATVDREGAGPVYRAPALDKGLDVLECLAASGMAMTQAQIARALARRPSELFRVLTTLERRGFVARDPASGGYALTLRLFELGHAHSPYDGLLRLAERPMRALSDETGQGCHLSVIRRGVLLVLHQEESPARVRVSVEVGSTIEPVRSASGRVLLAALDEERRREVMTDADADAALAARLALIRERGYEEAHGETVEGVSDLSVPVGTAASSVRAALAVAALPRDHADFVRETLPPIRHCAEEIARAAGIVGAAPGTAR